jgi:hypothetical protein
MEIESALVAHPRVAESAVVGKPHDIKGESVFAYVVLNVPRPEGRAAAELLEELRSWVAEQLSPIAKPDEIRLTDNLPKTRSGKIMRRLLRSIARGEEITQDMSTLENPAILEQLRGGVGEPAPAMQAAPGMRAAPAKQAAPGMRASSAMRAVRSERGAGAKKVAARPKTKKTAVRIRRGKAKKTEVTTRRAKRVTRVKKSKRKVVAAKSRRAAVKAVRRKPRGKK